MHQQSQLKCLHNCIIMHSQAQIPACPKQVLFICCPNWLGTNWSAHLSGWGVHGVVPGPHLHFLRTRQL